MRCKLICEDCGKTYEGGWNAYYCPSCRKKRQSAAAKRRNLHKLGNDAYSMKKRTGKKAVAALEAQKGGN